MRSTDHATVPTHTLTRQLRERLDRQQRQRRLAVGEGVQPVRLLLLAGVRRPILPPPLAHEPPLLLALLREG